MLALHTDSPIERAGATALLPGFLRGERAEPGFRSKRF